MKTVCQLNSCTGCMACADACHTTAIKVVDDINAYNAVIDESLCVNCGQCQRVCQILHPVSKNAPISWHQGWARQEEIRARASSGGVATAIAASFVEAGGICCSCVFLDGQFVFKCAENLADIACFSGSKYVKSNPIGIYKKIATLLKQKKVLLIALPCQIAAAKKFVGDNENLYTVDLICHGTPSPQLLKSFSKEQKRDLSSLKSVEFRQKTQYHLSLNAHLVQPTDTKDLYTVGFLKSLFHTENCYHCSYAQLERVADVTLGDSWGSDLADEELKKGVSLVLCQTEKGRELIENANLELFDVNLHVAISSNHQLKKPSSPPAKRSLFFKKFCKRKRFSSAMRACYPKTYFSRAIKSRIYALKNKWKP